MNLIYILLSAVFLFTTPTPTPTASPALALTTVAFSSPDVSIDNLRAAAAVVEARLQALDLDYAAVTTENTDNLSGSVLIELEPDALTPRVIELLTQPGYLELVDLGGLEGQVDDVGTRLWTTGQEARLIERIPRPLDLKPPEGALLDPETDQPFQTVLDGTAVTSAEVLKDSVIGGWIIEVTLSDDGAAIMEDYSAAHLGEPLAIVVDGVILSVPVLQSAISSPIWIQGNFTEAEARELAAQLGSGPLPVSLEFASIRSE